MGRFLQLKEAQLAPLNIQNNVIYWAVAPQALETTCTRRWQAIKTLFQRPEKRNSDFMRVLLPPSGKISILRIKIYRFSPFVGVFLFLFIVV